MSTRFDRNPEIHTPLDPRPRAALDPRSRAALDPRPRAALDRSQIARVAARAWPIAVVAVLGITVVANVALLVAAGDERASAVEPDYYRKAIAWDSTRAERDRSLALGWRIDATLEPARASGTMIRARVLDRDGIPIDGARLTVEAIPNADSGHRARALLSPHGQGRYAVRLALVRAGLWELRFEAVRDRDRFTGSVRADCVAVKAGARAAPGGGAPRMPRPGHA